MNNAPLITISNNTSYKKDPLMLSVLLLVGVGLLIGGFYTKYSYEKEDSLRTVKENVKVSKITKYDVAYEPVISITSMNVKPTKVRNITPEAIKIAGDTYSFSMKNSQLNQVLPIGKVIKEVSEIQVESLKYGTATISSTYFTKEITENDVSKNIDVEFDPNNLKNISMAVDGLSWSQWTTIVSMILVGFLLIMFNSYMLYLIYFPKKTEQKQ
jgi:hypothetical protein